MSENILNYSNTRPRRLSFRWMVEQGRIFFTLGAGCSPVLPQNGGGCPVVLYSTESGVFTPATTQKVNSTGGPDFFRGVRSLLKLLTWNFLDPLNNGKVLFKGHEKRRFTGFDTFTYTLLARLFAFHPPSTAVAVSWVWRWVGCDGPHSSLPGQW